MPISKTYNLDVMEYLKCLEDGAFDLAIADPNYGISVNHNMGRRKGDKKSDYAKVTWDSAPPPVEFFKELFRVSKNQIIWGANHFIDRMPIPSSCWLMWDKSFSEDVSFAQFELAWTSFDGTCKKFDMHPSQQFRIHPTQKPPELYFWMLNRYARPGDKIFDPMMGSQSSRIAAWDMGFDYWGCEKDADYFRDGEARFKKHVANKTTLFAPEQMYDFKQTTLDL